MFRARSSSTLSPSQIGDQTQVLQRLIGLIGAINNASNATFASTGAEPLCVPCCCCCCCSPQKHCSGGAV